MSRFVKIAALGLITMLCFCSKISFALDTEIHGRIQSTYVLRDVDGFQSGVLDEAHGVQWRNELKFDVIVKPEDFQVFNLKLEKVFLSYRGAYDAIFEIRDRYDVIREKSPADFELGKDDIEYENDLREGFVDLTAQTDRQSFVLRLGRQLVQWGEADGFNVLNIINPQDNSTLMFFENVEDLATPLWMARMNYVITNIGPFRSVGLELVGIPDIRPHLFAPLDDEMASPYAFGFKYLKGKDLLFFHELSEQYGFTAMGYDLGSINDLEELLTLFSHPDPITKWKEDVPGNSVRNLEYGGKLQFYLGNFTLGLHYFHGFQDDPAMDFSELLSKQTLTFRHPEQDIYGISFNCYVPSINAVIRGESCLTNKMAMVDLEGVNGNIGELLSGWGLVPPDSIPGGKTGYVKKEVYQSLLAVDKSLWSRWLNPAQMINISLQGYWKHIDDWDYDSVYRPFDEEDQFRLTGYVYTDYWHGRIHPELFVMYDPEGTFMTMASVKYTKDGKLFYKLTQMSFWGDDDAISSFTQPVDLTATSEISFRIGYNW